MPQSAAHRQETIATSDPDPIADSEFQLIRDFLYQQTGIDLAPSKKVLVTARLGKRLHHHGLSSFRQYADIVIADTHPGERQTMLDLLTTNETYFFREPGHFDFMREQVLPGRRRDGEPFRVWSAASSSGEEAYSIAMLLADQLGKAPWEVFGSDISERILKKGRAAHYPMNRIDGIPDEYLKRYCLRGTDSQEGTLLIERSLRERVSFAKVNLNREISGVGRFDVVFLRNVLIYFNQETKTQIVRRVLSQLRSGGHFFIGHSETLKGVNEQVQLVAPTTYIKP